jgi:hypothetical protein
MKNLILAIVILVSGLVTAQDDWRDSYEVMFYEPIEYDTLMKIYYKVVPSPSKAERMYKGVFDNGGNDYSYITKTLIRDSYAERDILKAYNLAAKDLKQLDFIVSENISIDDLLDMYEESKVIGRNVSRKFAVNMNTAVLFYVCDNAMFISIDEYN